MAVQVTFEIQQWREDLQEWAIFVFAPYEETGYPRAYMAWEQMVKDYPQKKLRLVKVSHKEEVCAQYPV